MSGKLPAWLTDEGQRKARLRRQNARSAAQEASLASDLGGRVQGGSGSSWRARGDVRTDGEIVEAKYTDRDSYSLKVSTWKKIVKAAHATGREPVMVIEFSAHGLTLEVRVRE